MPPQRIIFTRTVTSHFRLLFLLAVTLLPLAAQKLPAPRAPLNAEDPELYFAFFRAHATLARKIGAAQPAVAVQLTSHTAALYLISDGDLPRVTDEVEEFMVMLAAWQVREQKYVTQARASHQPLDMNRMIRFQYQRERLVMATLYSIHNAISEGSWLGLHNYVNGAFKGSVIGTNSISSGWQQLSEASFLVTRRRRSNHAPELGTLLNTTGVVESTQTVTFTASDPDGASNLARIDFQMNTPTNLAMNGGENACFGVWFKSFASVFIFDDALLYWYQVPLGSGSPYSNSQCTVYGVGSSFTLSGNTGTLSLQIRFTGALAGTLDMYERVFNLSMASNSGGWGDISTTSGNNVTVNGAAVNADAPSWTQIMLSSGSTEVNYFKYVADPADKIEIAQSAVPIGGSSSFTDLYHSPRPPYTYNFSAIAASPAAQEYNTNVGRNVCALGPNQNTTFTGDYSISPAGGRAQTDAAEFNDSRIESGIRGFEFRGSFNGNLAGSERAGVSAIDVVYLHDQACSLGGHEYGFAKIINVSGPDSGGGHLFFYYADHANCGNGNCNASDSVADTRFDVVDLVNLQANSASTYEYYFKVYLVPSENVAFAPWGYFFRVQVVDPLTSALAKCTVNGSAGDCEVDMKMQSWFRADLANGLSARVQSGILASNNPDNAGNSPGLYVDLIAVGQ